MKFSEQLFECRIFEMVFRNSLILADICLYFEEPWKHSIIIFSNMIKFYEHSTKSSNSKNFRFLHIFGGDAKTAYLSNGGSQFDGHFYLLITVPGTPWQAY